jgi:pSer/pThr/pTyr-binding forkhead associated (FHA) protein
MSRLQIPYTSVLVDPIDYDPDRFDSVLRKSLDDKSAEPVVIEVFNDHVQYLSFIRDGQVYWCCMSDPEGFSGLTVREFFSSLRRTQFPKVIVYSVNLLLFHSLIVFLQTKPELKVSSTLVDLDELLDRIESEKRSALVTALQPGNLVMLRYKEGLTAACYHGLSTGISGETTRREDFLVKVYTMATRAAFEIRIFTDMVVTHSEDARQIPADFAGPVSAFFLSQPPKLIVKLKNRPLKTYNFTGKQITIGRLPENDITIDNLSVSRKHAVIHSVRSGYVLRDLGSKNGTLLNGEKVEHGELNGGDTISIGKYEIAFQVCTGEEGAVDTLDQTVIIPRYHSECAPEKESALTAETDTFPRLYRCNDQEEYPIEGDNLVIGRGREADIRLKGLFAPRVKVNIHKSGPDWVLETDGRKAVRVNGEKLEEKVLREEDLIAIGSEEFVFKH